MIYLPAHMMNQGLDDGSGAVVEVEYDGRRLLVQPISGVEGRIVRLISTDPADYLNPAWQPGQPIRFVPGAGHT
ncbi:MAG: YlzJ-like family protein [Acetobacteraceae bacterium]|nr:YlzJ-like family protein [Acetobacteraceae bacterium]